MSLSVIISKVMNTERNSGTFEATIDGLNGLK